MAKAARKSKVVAEAEAVKVLEQSGLVAELVSPLDPEVQRTVALYEAARNGDNDAFTRIRDGR